MGKRFHAKHFISEGHKETHCCDYLLATDLEMGTPDGYEATSWEDGYGDYTMKPDLTTLRKTPWLDGTAMVICDVLDHHTHEEVTHSPRAILKKQIKRLQEMGFDPIMATELEFFLFEKSFKDLQTTKEEHIMRPLRNYLWDAGIPVENSKGEAETGQEELNIKYDNALNTAEHHTIALLFYQSGIMTRWVLLHMFISHFGKMERMLFMILLINSV